MKAPLQKFIEKSIEFFINVILLFIKQILDKYMFNISLAHYLHRLLKYVDVPLKTFVNINYMAL